MDPLTPVIVAARRTPIGTAGHGLRALTVDALAAAAFAAVVADLPSSVTVDEVVLGNCLGPGGNVARVAALRAGLDLSMPARTIANRIRGFTPWPGAFTTLDGKTLRVLASRAMTRDEENFFERKNAE